MRCAVPQAKVHMTAASMFHRAVGTLIIPYSSRWIATSRSESTRRYLEKGHSMSELLARIKDLQHTVRQALNDQISAKEYAEIAVVVEAMREALGDQDFS